MTSSGSSVDIDSQPPVAVVTGAAQGIGAAITSALLRQGWDVHMLDVRADVQDVAATLTDGTKGTAWGYICDVTDRARVQEIVASITNGHQHLTGLVNNAGWTPNQRFLEQDPDLWERILAVNLHAVLTTTAAIAPYLRRHGAIVNVASDAARIGVPKEAVYAAAKAGVIAFSKSLAIELGRDQIRVNVVSPGTTATPLVTEALSAEQQQRRIKANPMGRLGQPDEVAEVVRWMLCDATYVNGQVLSVNGGATRVG